ncbi:MAG TPA: TM1812 family CRISPR-associated protein [Phycisphaerales bacterium]|nr:TM1812 family CRISPR-associated protein [Phycisphaerales bacterium]HMP38566.1 TM1812 family CRISPR-associated protein [Phycisphaerales bacterium]
MKDDAQETGAGSSKGACLYLTIAGKSAQELAYCRVDGGGTPTLNAYDNADDAILELFKGESKADPGLADEVVVLGSRSARGSRRGLRAKILRDRAGPIGDASDDEERYVLPDCGTPAKVTEIRRKMIDACRPSRESPTRLIINATHGPRIQQLILQEVVQHLSALALVDVLRVHYAFVDDDRGETAVPILDVTSSFRVANETWITRALHGGFDGGLAATGAALAKKRQRDLGRAVRGPCEEADAAGSTEKFVEALGGLLEAIRSNHIDAAIDAVKQLDGIADDQLRQDAPHLPPIRSSLELTLAEVRELRETRDRCRTDLGAGGFRCQAELELRFAAIALRCGMIGAALQVAREGAVSLMLSSVPPPKPLPAQEKDVRALRERVSSAVMESENPSTDAEGRPRAGRAASGSDAPAEKRVAVTPAPPDPLGAVDLDLIPTDWRAKYKDLADLRNKVSHAFSSGRGISSAERERDMPVTTIRTKATSLIEFFLAAATAPDAGETRA